MKILLVEDDRQFSTALVKALDRENYLTEVENSSQKALQLLASKSYNLLLLKINLPETNGINICRQLRSKGSNIPILLLADGSSKTEKIQGLDAGADDYLVKPLDLPELCAHIRALLRRSYYLNFSALQWGDLRLVPDTGEATYCGQPLQLTSTEYNLLALLMRSGRRIFSCTALIESLWSWQKLPSESTLRSHIKKLRKKLKAVGAEADLIETVYGLGYRLKEIK